MNSKILLYAVAVLAPMAACALVLKGHQLGLFDLKTAFLILSMSAAIASSALVWWVTYRAKRADAEHALATVEMLENTKRLTAALHRAQSNFRYLENAITFSPPRHPSAVELSGQPVVDRERTLHS